MENPTPGGMQRCGSRGTLLIVKNNARLPQIILWMETNDGWYKEAMQKNLKRPLAVG